MSRNFFKLPIDVVLKGNRCRRNREKEDKIKFSAISNTEK